MIVVAAFSNADVVVMFVATEVVDVIDVLKSAFNVDKLLRWVVISELKVLLIVNVGLEGTVKMC